METRSIKEDRLAGIIGKMSQDMPVFAPVKEEDNVLFKQLEKGQAPLIRFANSKNAPKNFFFPHSEQMMKYTRTENGMAFAGAAEVAKESVLFGVRPCDAHSYLLLDMLFDQEKYRDPFYIDKREKTIVISLACAHPPYTTCFCTSVDGSPTSADGADILLTEIGTDYLAEFITPKGEKLLKYFADTPKADDQALAAKKAVAEKAAQEIKSHIPAKAIKPILDVNFEHPFWNTIHQKCLACGTCTYLCPTCHCFDINDESTGSSPIKGNRVRTWDNCQFPDFTMHTSGHNPRENQGTGNYPRCARGCL